MPGEYPELDLIDRSPPGEAMGDEVYWGAIPCFFVVMGTAGLVLLILLTQVPRTQDWNDWNDWKWS